MWDCTMINVEYLEIVTGIISVGIVVSIDLEFSKRRACGDVDNALYEW